MNDAVGALTKGVVNLQGANSNNSGDTIFGSSKGSIVTTEVDDIDDTKTEPVTISEQVWSGWSMKKKNLQNLVNKWNEAYKGQNSGRPIIRVNYFNDTDDVQLYEMRSTWVIYPSAFAKLYEKMRNPNPPSDFRPKLLKRLAGWDAYSETDRSLFEALVNMYGHEQFRLDCKRASGEARANPYRDSIAVSVLQGGNFYECLPHWMAKILKMRRQMDFSSREAKASWQNRIFFQLERNVSVERLMDYLGKDNFFFQLSINGFRKGDEGADALNDRNLTGYQTDTLGKIDPTYGFGPFRDFMGTLGNKISSHEVYARYLREAN